MADIKKAITSTAAIVVLFCLFQNGYSLRYDDDFPERQFDDWQPSKSSALRAKPTASTDPPSPYEPFNDSSLSPTTTGRNVRQRSRERNGRVEPLQKRQGIANGNSNSVLNQGYRFNVEQAQDTEPVQRSRNGYGSSFRQRNSPRTVPEDTLNGGDYQNRGRNYDGAELPTRRHERGPRNRVESERRMGLALENEQVVRGQVPVSDVNNIQRPYRGRKQYSDKRVSEFEPRGPNTRGRTRGFSSRYTNIAQVTPSPVGYTEVTQKAYIVLPENQQHSQYQLNEINQRYQERGVEYQRQRQNVAEPNQHHNRGQYHVEVQPGTSEQKPRPYTNRDSNLIDYRNPQKEQKSDYVYSQYSHFSPEDASTPPQFDFVVPSQQSVPQEEFNQISPIPHTTSQSGRFESATSRQTHIPETSQHFRSRQSVRRTETTAKLPIGETISTNYQKPVTHQRGGNKHESVLQSNTVADSGPEKKTIEQGTQRDALGRQRRRQGPTKLNQRTGIYTVLPSNIKTTTEPGQITTTAAFYTPRTRSVPVRENQVRYNSFRNRSRSQQTSTTTEPDPPKQQNDDEPEKQTPSPVKPTLRAITRLIQVTTAKPAETKPEEDIDETDNYPKEFLDKLKVSKKFVPPSKQAQLPRVQITTSPPLESVSTTTNNDQETSQQTTQRGRYSQSFYRKLAAKASYNSPPRQNQKPEQGANTRFPSNKFNPSTTTPQQTTTTETITTPETHTDAITPPQERKKFVPKNKLSPEERKHRIEILKEKLRQNATEAEQDKLRETLVPQANTHPASREEPDPSFTRVKTSNRQATSSPRQSEDGPNTRTTKYDLITQGSEDNVHVVYFNRSGLGLGPGSAPPSSTPFPATATTTPVSIHESKSASTREPEFAVLNVTLFPSTRHRFSSRINSTTNLTLPRDVELITAPPTVLDSPEILLPREPSLALSVQNLFNSSPNSSAASLRPQETLSVTQLFDQTTPRVSSTTKRSTNKKSSSGRKKSSKNSAPSSANRTAKSKNTRRQSSGNKAKTSTNNKKPAATVRTPPQGTSDNNSNNTIGSNSTGTANGVQPLTLALPDIETIINETVEVVHSNPMTSPQPATVPRSQLNALTPETFSTGGNTSPGTPTTEMPETTTFITTPNTTDNPTNTTDSSHQASDVQCSGETCRNATSPSLRINNDQGRQAATTKSPETLRQIFIFGLFPNNTIQRRPFNESAVERSSARGALSSSTTSTTTTTAQPDYDVFGIYPNNSVVRRRGWKTFDHERYMSPYVIFGIYPNNTIVKKYPNGTIIRDEFMISDNEIRNIMSERKTQADCPCAKNGTASDTDGRTSTTTPSTATTTENPDQGTTTAPDTSTETNPKNDAESIDLNNVTEPQTSDARELNDVTTTETPQPTTQREDEDVRQEEEETETEKDEDEDEEEEEEEINATTPSGEERLEDIEEVDDASTPRLGIGETTTATFDQVTEDNRLIDGTSPSTTPMPDVGLANAEKADRARIISTTGHSIPGPTEVTDRADYAERTTTGEDVTDKTTTELFYYRPTANSPLSLNIHEGLVEKLPPKVVIVTPSTATRKPITQNNPKTQNAFQGLPFFRNNLLGNLLANLGLLNQPTPLPKAKTLHPVIPSSTLSPVDHKTTTATPPTTTQIPKTLPDERFAIDLFGLNTLENTPPENNNPTTTTNRIPTTTLANPSVTTILPNNDVSRDDLKEVQILQALKPHTVDAIYRTNEGHILKESDIFLNVVDDPRAGTTVGPIEYIQNVNSPTAPYAYERVTPTPIYDYDFPSERPLTGAGIVSITYDDQFDSSTPNHLQAYHIGQPTGPTYIQRITPRHASVTPVPDNAINSTEPELDIRRLGNLITKLSNSGRTEPTTEGFAAETTTTSELLNALSLDDIQSAVNGNQITKRQRKPAGKSTDEPSSLTNIAYRALSSSNEIPLLDIVATTAAASTQSSPTTTPTTTVPTTQTKPKKTKPGPASPPRNKVKKMSKNLSRTSVMAFRNLTEFTSTPLPETVFIVTPVAKTDPDDGFRPEPGEVRRPKIKFVTLTPGYVVTTDTHTEKRNQLLTLSSQHVQKVTKAPAKLPENFLSTVYGQIEQKASSPIPEILKNVGNDISEADGLSVSLAKRIITLALEKAISNGTTQTTPETDPIYPSSPRFPTTTPYFTTPKQNPTTKKPVDATKRPKPPPKTTTTTTTTTTTEQAKPAVSVTTKRQTVQTPTTTETPIVITPKIQAARPFQMPQTVDNVAKFPFVQPSSTAKPPAKYVSNIDPLNHQLFDKGAPTNPPSSQKITEDLNALLSGLWDESPTKSPPSFTEKPSTETPKTTTIPQRANDDKITLPKKASDSLSESDLKLLEGILSQQGFEGGTQDLEQIVQNQIRLAEEVRKASRNFKKKQKTTTTTTHRPESGGLGFLFNLFGSQGPSNPPVLRGNSRKPQKPSQSESYTSLANTPDPINELDGDLQTADRTARGELVTAAIDVTKAVSKFMGTVLTNAAQSFQSFIRSLRS